MAINLQKGQTINLDKTQFDLSQVLIGLGWDVNQTGGSSFDLDAFALLLNQSEKLANDKDLVYFGNLKHPSGNLWHTGDNTTGEGDGDDEQLIVKLDSLSSVFQKVLFAVNIYEATKRNQHFGKIQNAFIRAVDNKGKEMARFELSGSEYIGKTAMIFAEVYRKDNGWKFRAIGNPISAESIHEVKAKYK